MRTLKTWRCVRTSALFCATAKLTLVIHFGMRHARLSIVHIVVFEVSELRVALAQRIVAVVVAN
jgi:hypothetical protein